MLMTAKILTLAGVPSDDVLEDVLADLLGPILDLGLEVNNGPVISTETGITPLLAHLREVPRRGITARGSQGLELSIRWHNSHGVLAMAATGSITIVYQHNEMRTEQVESVVRSALTKLHAPLATIEPNNGPFAQQRSAVVEAYQATRPKGEGRFDLAVGLTGFAWKTLLGEPLVEFFTEDALHALPDELASKVDSIWTVSTAADPADLDAQRAGDAAVRSALGNERFFDLETQTEPTLVPDIPELAPIPISIRVKDAADNWVWTHFNHE